MPLTDNLTNDIERAVDEMFDMNKRAKQPKINRDNNTGGTKQKNSISDINISSDTLLILGLILILSNENSDKFLLLAMLYILS